jgi:membrane-bound lytic murein transglycosylase D
MRAPQARRRPLLAVALLIGLWLAMPAASAMDEATPAPTEVEEATGDGTTSDGRTGSGEDGSGTLTTPAPRPRTGLDIYRDFREGLADPECEPGASARWRQHFAHAPAQLAAPGSDVLPLFGYIVDALRAAHLPTEYALIPFVESGYRPGARSPSGPAGLWQFIALTARNHNVPIVDGYDGRLSPVDSTTAAVRYLKTLHGMFAGDWRLAVMAFNAGEYRVLGALRRSGQAPADADHEKLALPALTRAYVRKLHALSCIFEEVEERDAWLRSLDRPVPVLTAMPVPQGIASLDALARARGLDAPTVRRLNPAFAGGRIGPRGRSVLVPGTATQNLPVLAAATPAVVDGFLNEAVDPGPSTVPDGGVRTHTVVRGDSAWAIARRYGIRSTELLARNGLDARSVLHPGMVLRIDDAPAQPPAPGVAE